MNLQQFLPRCHVLWVYIRLGYAFTAYRIMVGLLCHLLQEGRSSTGVNFASGAAAAVVATLATQPADVIRTRMQLVAANGKHLGPVKTLQVAMQTGGAKALLVGALPRVSMA